MPNLTKRANSCTDGRTDLNYRKASHGIGEFGEVIEEKSSSSKWVGNRSSMKKINT